METNAPQEPQETVKGEIKIDINGFVFHPHMTEEERESGNGDVFCCEPILYTITLPVGEVDEKRLFDLPQKMIQEVIMAMAHTARMLRTHKPDPTKLVVLSGEKKLQTGNMRILDASGNEIKKH